MIKKEDIIIELDDKANPVFSKKIELGAVQVETESGNPFHDAFTGKFSFKPPGVEIIFGSRLVKGLPTPQRKLLFARAAASKANQMTARLVQGKISMYLFRDGRFLDAFSMAATPDEQGKGKEPKKANEPLPGKTGIPGALEPEARDQALIAARDYGLIGKSLEQFIEDFLPELDDNEKKRFEEEVVENRLNDLIHYLNIVMRKKVLGVSNSDTIRISVFRGYTRKTFANLSVEQSQKVFNRLQALGWSEEQLQDNVAGGLPKRIKENIFVAHKQSEEKQKRQQS